MSQYKPPVNIYRSWFVPRGFRGWVPRKRTIIFSRSADVTVRLLAHELRHVIQAENAPWPAAYVAQWAASGFSYWNMPFEYEARRAEGEAFYRDWASTILASRGGRL